MGGNDDRTRVLIALTESSPVDQLWEAALGQLGQAPADLTALFFAETRWHRAASLSFTREISRLSGADVDFTRQRASQINEEAIRRAETLVNKLAEESKLSPTFEVLNESDQERIRELVSGAENLLIAPSFIIRRPLFAEFKKLGCRIELVEVSGSPEAKSAGCD
jgi:hypothetical protein